MTAVLDSSTNARDGGHPWRYRSEEPRDRRLDLLRGYALAAMAVNHFGLSQSYVHEVSGRSSFLISAAEAFLFISGFTLGYISSGRTAEDVTGRLRRRTWIVYLATVGISLGLSAVALTTHLELWGGFEAGAYGSVWQWIGEVVTMRAGFNGADILIAYVLYLGVAIGALRLMAAGRTRVVIAAVAGLYLLAQLSGPEAVQLGFASFRVLIPNAPLFFGGLVLGFHRAEVAAWWRRFPWRRAADGAVVVAALVLGWLHATEYEAWAPLGTWINGPDVTEPLWRRESSMPLPALLVVGLYLRAGWLAVDALWVPLRSALGWLLLPLGEASLFTFTMHLLAIPVMVNLPMWSDDDLGRWTATAWVLAYLGLIWLTVLARQSVLGWLRRAGDARAWVRRHGPATVVGTLVVVLLVVSVGPTGAAGDWSSREGGFADEELEEDDEVAAVEDEVGEVIDRVADGDLTVDDALGLLPEEVPDEDRERVAELLDTDPFAAEMAIVEVLLSE